MAAALQSPAEGLPKPSLSFREALTSSQSLPIIYDSMIKEGGQFKGEPALIFSTSEVAVLAAPFQLTLIGKFIGIRPSMEFIKKGFATIGFKGDYSLGLLDPQHILIRFSLPEDYHRCWMHGHWSFKKHIMKVIKWTPEFSPDHEAPYAPVWVSFEHLPIHLFQKGPLLSLANLIGRPLKIDSATQTLSRPSVARISVEVDLQKTLPQRVWIGQGTTGFWQSVTYENLPSYCSDCHRVGHATGDCDAATRTLLPPPKKVWHPKLQQAPNMQQQLHQQQNVPVSTEQQQQTIPANESQFQPPQPNTSRLSAFETEKEPIPVDIPSAPSSTAKQSPDLLLSHEKLLDATNSGLMAKETEFLPIVNEAHQSPASTTSVCPPSTKVLATAALAPAAVPTVTFVDPENPAEITQEKLFANNNCVSSGQFVPLPTHSPKNRENPGPQLEIILPIWPQQFTQQNFKNYQNSDDEEGEDEDDEEDFFDKQFVRDDSYLEDRKSRRISRDQFSVQFRRGRGRPPGSRRTYSEVIRTINTRAKTVD